MVKKFDKKTLYTRGGMLAALFGGAGAVAFGARPVNAHDEAAIDDLRRCVEKLEGTVENHERRIRQLEGSAEQPPPSLSPSGGGISLGVYQGSFYNQGVTAGMDAEAQLLGRYPKVFMWYPDASRRWPFERAKADYAASKGADIHLTWEWFGVSYASIANGEHDAYIRQYARDSAAYGRPILMRVFHEMNGDWYSWQLSSDAVADNHKAAWRRIVTIFRQENATNVKFFWCPNEGGVYDSRLQRAWPGDEYVDVIGVDGYNWGTTNGGWRSAEQIVRPKYDQLTSWSDRPFAVGEINSREAGGSKAAWVEQARNQLSQDFPRLIHVTLFDANYGGYNDWRIDSSQSSLSAYRAWFADNRYLLATL